MGLVISRVNRVELIECCFFKGKSLVATKYESDDAKNWQGKASSVWHGNCKSTEASCPGIGRLALVDVRAEVPKVGVEEQIIDVLVEACLL